ncbi:MAG: hypothetical protein JW716_02095 [Candidatus Aenigmarchaeota archaeon]|nr:hypothetical protein [Candidatus Aenigmarchaeota archaeon]
MKYKSFLFATVLIFVILLIVIFYPVSEKTAESGPAEDEPIIEISGYVIKVLKEPKGEFIDIFLKGEDYVLGTITLNGLPDTDIRVKISTDSLPWGDAGVFDETENEVSDELFTLSKGSEKEFLIKAKNYEFVPVMVQVTISDESEKIIDAFLFESNGTIS